ncbi:acyl-CoA dehydrogenase [Algihabitans albus]|uniref:acyl-CoA dehydrogenase n=1 Tax=Algihabitans albus TaxID=2164067 RepID=UPI000E5D1449|nr:acyl-CoA dehydrogenase [Algihabitans albus]
MNEPLLDPRDLNFLLYEMLDVEALTRLPRFADHGRDTFDAALETARQIAGDRFRTHNRKSDLQEPRFRDGRVETIPEIKSALDAFNAAGFTSANFDYAQGGMQLPWVVAQACFAWFQAANISTVAYPFLTIAAANLLERFANAEQKRRYLGPMLEGRFFGTMALSEPQAGSSLGDIRTTAEPLGEGRYRLTGSKMWISGAAHDLSETIVNLMLARVRGGPAGVKGLSLFVVPRDRVGEDGRIGGSNDVTVTGLNHKMGYRGTTNTVLSIGEDGGCIGELIGEEGKGLAYMFHMMNEARIGVGMGAAALAATGYLYALDYARERLQGRHPDDKDPAAPQIRLIEHADVRRMLLVQKAVGEGGLALGLYAALLVDRRALDPESDRRARAGLLLEIVTPIYKAYISERALEANDLSIQVLGGYGYTRDYPVEQFYRDNRLNPIHEGANGVQAIDLLGRKVRQQEGAALRALIAEMRATAETAAAQPGLAEEAAGLAAALDLWETTTRQMVAAAARKGERAYLANASLYMTFAGQVTLAWIWLWQAVLSSQALAAAPDAPTTDFYRGKLQTCRYVFRFELPKALALADTLAALDATCLEMQPAWF